MPNEMPAWRLAPVPPTRAGADLGAALRTGAQAVGARDGSLLLAHALGVRREELYLRDHQSVLPPEVVRRFLRLVRLRRRGRPLAYLMGSAPFWDMDLAVAPGVLVPRPETEHLVEAVIAAVPATKAHPTIVDVGTGSGAIAIALARTLAGATVFGSDRSASALRVAAGNVRRWAPSVLLLGPGDLLEPLVRHGAKADIVVMNPPYVRTRDMAHLPRDVQHEPRHALDGGRDGLRVVRRLIACVRRGEAVRPGCQVWLEVGAGQAPAVEALVATLGGPTAVLADLAGIDRVVGGRWPG